MASYVKKGSGNVVSHFLCNTEPKSNLCVCSNALSCVRHPRARACQRRLMKEDLFQSSCLYTSTSAIQRYNTKNKTKKNKRKVRYNYRIIEFLAELKQTAQKLAAVMAGKG